MAKRNNNNINDLLTKWLSSVSSSCLPKTNASNIININVITSTTTTTINVNITTTTNISNTTTTSTTSDIKTIISSKPTVEKNSETF